MTFARSYTKEPLEYKLRKKILEYGKNNLEIEKNSAKNLALDIQKWDEYKKNLTTMKQKENKFIIQNKSLVEEKNKTLKTTVAQRCKAEKEINALNDSAKALQALINKINAQKKQNKNTSPKKEKILRHNIVVKRKKSLPWPVRGQVISYFGKIKHPQLNNTYVINNGIKINAPDYSKIKAIDGGKVVFTGNFRSYGKVIIIEDNNTIFYVYGLLNEVYVKEGQMVSKESIIANIGKGKNSVLYLEILQNNIPDNPLLWLQTINSFKKGA
jgi:septal ring factor EnvC (AmiA/AmiB activator)